MGSKAPRHPPGACICVLATASQPSATASSMPQCRHHPWSDTFSCTVLNIIVPSTPHLSGTTSSPLIQHPQTTSRLQTCRPPALVSPIIPHYHQDMLPSIRHPARGRAHAGAQPGRPTPQRADRPNQKTRADSNCTEHTGVCPSALGRPVHESPGRSHPAHQSAAAHTKELALKGGQEASPQSLTSPHPANRPKIDISPPPRMKKALNSVALRAGGTAPGQQQHHVCQQPTVSMHQRGSLRIPACAARSHSGACAP